MFSLPDSTTSQTTANSNGIALIDPEVLANSVHLCRSCWAFFENPDLLDERECECGQKLFAEPKQHWMKSLAAAQRAPLSDETRAKISANSRLPHRRGAQSPDDKRRVSNHAWKHGAYAKQHQLPPAKHGAYAACKSCQFADPSQNPAGNGQCKAQQWTYCAAAAPKLFALHNAHIGKGGAEALRELMAGIQGKELFLLDMALSQVLEEGITIEDKTTRDFGEKGFTEETVTKLHPAMDGVKILSNALGGTGLSDWKLTPRSESDAKVTASLGELADRLLSPFNPQSLPDPHRRTREQAEQTEDHA